MKNFIDELQRDLSCEVRIDPVSTALYATDASIYEVTPLAVVLPRTKEDLIKTVQIASRHKIPIIPRGGATGITGGCLGKGVVIDTSKYLNNIIAIDYEKEIAIVQPGVIQDDLNKALAKRGYRLGPDTSTGNRATIGGMVGNNAAGHHALQFGRMVDHVEAVELILSYGDIITCQTLTTQEWEKKCSLQTREGALYRDISHLRQQYQKIIENEFPKIKRRASGYNLDELIHPAFNNLSKLITGSEGTFGIISEITVKITKRPEHHVMALIASKNMIEGLRSTCRYLDFHPQALELVDKNIMEAGKTSPIMNGKLGFLQNNPDALFIAEFQGSSQRELEKRARRFLDHTQSEPHVLWSKLITDEKTQDNVWQLRKSGLGLLLSKRSHSRAIAFIEDVAVPPENLSKFIQDFTSLLKRYHKEAGIYGHIGDSCLHIRPYIDLRKSDELHTMKQIMLEVADLVASHGGVMSGEHGDGLIRSWLNEKVFGERIYKVFQELKAAFDPDALMNPGKIVATQGLLENIRPQTTSLPFTPFLDFSKEGGFELAADMCNGNGQCRKKAGSGLMCPSFQASLDEKDSTRGRANALRAIIHGKIPTQELFSESFHETMDLCIQCKGCKTECPSQVDMAKMKAEYLYQYHNEKGYPLRSYLFGHIGFLYSLGSFFPKISNSLLRSSIIKRLLSFIGITPKRRLPELAQKRFSESIRKSPSTNKKIVLFPDTFTEFTTPHIGRAAVTLLERLGYEVIVPKYTCCGRTLISKGLLKEASKKASKLVELLYPYAEQHIIITGLEPSCILTLADEFQDFHLDKQKVSAITSCSKTIDEVLSMEIDALLPHLHECHSPVFVHGHCHQKALVGMQHSLQILKRICSEVYEIPSGCCGMAGSFGYEKEHYEFSNKIGELVLLPTVRKHQNHAIIVANGTSCRRQIIDNSDTKPLHLVELLAKLLKK